MSDQTHQTLSVRYCTPEDCTDPRCPNYVTPQACPFCASVTGTHPANCPALTAASRLTLIEHQQHAYAQARWQELAGAK